MDPITFLIIAFIVSEALDGGFLTANAAGAGAAGGRAAWREASKGAKTRYAKRAKRLKKTAIGRWRLRTESVVAGLVAGLGKGLAAGVRDVPEGARQGRAVRKKALAGGRQKIRQGVDRIKERNARLVPDEAPEAEVTAAEVATPEQVPEGSPAAIPADPVLPSTTPETSPAPGGGTEEEPMAPTNDLSAVAEDRGVKPYVDAWDGEIGVMEQMVSAVSAIADRVAQAVEANSGHDPAGAQDVAGALAAAVESLQSAGEMVDGHAALLHQKWDGAIEQLQGTGAKSAQELVGAS